MNEDLKQSAGWLALASLIGFLVPAVFSTGLRWDRATYLVPYVAIVGVFLWRSFRVYPLSLSELVRRWPWGAVAAAIAVFLLLRNIQGQPTSAVPVGSELVFALVWIGLIYGVIDALLLNVMPVLVIYRAWPAGKTHARSARVLRGVAALGASMLVTVAYHLGYTEFQGPALLAVIVGNVIIASTYLLSGSPLAAIATHVVMHVAAVLHGMETTLQLPPHYAS